MQQTYLWQQTLAKALERIVDDPALRDRLEEQPLDTLAELGIELPPWLAVELSGKRLSDVAPIAVGRHAGQMIV